jgi:hypothetical protein
MNNDPDRIEAAMRNRGFSPEIKVNAVVLDPKSDFITSARIKNKKHEFV